MKNILEYLEKSAQQYFTKVAFTDENREMTYGSCVECSKKIGTALLELKAKRKPIAVLMDKNCYRLSLCF